MDLMGIINLIFNVEWILFVCSFFDEVVVFLG